MADYPVTPLTPQLTEQEIIRRQKLQKLLDAGKNFEEEWIPLLSQSRMI